MEIDRPEVVAEVTAAFNRYERALVVERRRDARRDLPQRPRTIRYGGGEIFTATTRSKRSAPHVRRRACGALRCEDGDHGLRPRPRRGLDAVHRRRRPARSAGRCNLGALSRRLFVVAAHVSRDRRAGKLESRRQRDGSNVSDRPPEYLQSSEQPLRRPTTHLGQGCCLEAHMTRD